MLHTLIRIAFYSEVFDALLECGLRWMEKRERVGEQIKNSRSQHSPLTRLNTQTRERDRI